MTKSQEFIPNLAPADYWGIYMILGISSYFFWKICEFHPNSVKILQEIW